MKTLIAATLASLCISAFAAGPTLKITVTEPGKIASWQFVSGDTVKITDTSIHQPPSYVYKQGIGLYDNNATQPLRLQGTLLPNAKTFPFQIIIGSCGQDEPTTAMWSNQSAVQNSILTISAAHAKSALCQSYGNTAGSGFITITPIGEGKYPVGTYTLQLNAV